MNKYHLLGCPLSWFNTLFYLFMYRSIPKPSIIPPRANPGAVNYSEKFWPYSPLCCQFRRSNAPPVWASKRVKSFIQMYIFCNKLLFGLSIHQNRKAVVVLRHTFTYEKKKLIQPTNYIRKQRRSPKARERSFLKIYESARSLVVCSLSRHARMKQTNINRIALYLWKQVRQNSQPRRICCSACLRSTL